MIMKIPNSCVRLWRTHDARDAQRMQKSCRERHFFTVRTPGVCLIKDKRVQPKSFQTHSTIEIQHLNNSVFVLLYGPLRSVFSTTRTRPTAAGQMRPALLSLPLLICDAENASSFCASMEITERFSVTSFPE